MTGQEFIDGCGKPLSRGDAWGDPLWTFHNEAANLSIDAQGATLDDARANALEAAEVILGDATPQVNVARNALAELDALDPKTASMADVIAAVKSALA